MNEIRERIEDLTYINSDILESIIEDIDKQEDYEVRDELFNTFILKIKELTQEEYKKGENKQDPERYIGSIYGKFIKFSSLREKEVTEYFEKNGLVPEEMLSPEEDKKEEEPKLNDEREQEIVETIQKLKEEQKELWRLGNTGNLSEEDEKRFEEITNQIKELEQELATITKEEIVEEEELEIVKINNRINELEEELKDVQSVEELEKQKAEDLAKIDERINTLKAEEPAYANEKELVEKLNKLEAEQKELWRLANNDSLNAADEKRFHEINSLVKETKEQLEIIKKEKFTDKNKDLDKLRKNLEERAILLLQRKKIVDSYDEKIVNSKNKNKELTELKVIRDSYCKIQSEAIQKFEKEKLSDEELKQEIVEFVNNHPLAAELTKWKEPDKLKVQLMNEIYKNLKVKKIDKKENKKKALLKGLSAVAGFGAGFALHSVPGVGTVLAGVWAVKMTKKVINVITNKFPNSKVTGIINGISDKVSEKYADFSENHPKIAKIVEKVRKVLKSDYTKWFVNGFTAGYAVGNIVDSITANNEPVSNNQQQTQQPQQQTAPQQQSTPQVTPMSNPGSVTLNPGDVVDISGIKEGLASSTSNNPISLITEAGKEAIVDKCVTLPDGRVMWHFKQITGQGYAWFEESVVKECLAKAAEAAAKTGGMSF